MNNKLYWMGIRESEVCYVKGFFEDSIIFFGNKQKGIKPLNQAINKNLNHNDEKNDAIMAAYRKSQMSNILAKYPDAEFMFYNQIKALKYYKGNRNIICLNDEALINKMSDKLFAREYFKIKVPCLQHYILFGREISCEKLKELFNDDSKQYVVQSKNGSGGSGTFIFHDNNQKALLNNDDQYLVTVYRKDSISTNTHLMLSKDETIVLPSSIQIIENQYDHLVYKGCDFVGFNTLSDEIKEKTDKYAKIIGDDLRKNGYLGVLGIDSIVCDGEVFFIEINSRFQNSSTALNKALLESGQQSLQEMNYNSFKNQKVNYSTITVNYSTYILDFGEQTSNIPDIEPIEVLDEAGRSLEVEKLSYQKTYLYDKSIYKR